ncbi:hypothetical protein BX666DRAFT_2026764 [Dichotomocladium elegans]|nr:hypothetical protein BX666DRAFT_2026764 [Dichotomocladium elegans]
MEPFSVLGTSRFPENHKGRRVPSRLEQFSSGMELQEEYVEPTFESVPVQHNLTSASLRSPHRIPTTFSSGTMSMTAQTPHAASYRDRLGDAPHPLSPTKYAQRPLPAVWQQQEQPVLLDALGRVTSISCNWDQTAHRCDAAEVSRLVDSSSGHIEPIGYSRQTLAIDHRGALPHRRLASMPILSHPPASSGQQSLMFTPTICPASCYSGYTHNHQMLPASVRKRDMRVPPPTWSQVTRLGNRPADGSVGKRSGSLQQASTGSSEDSESSPSPSVGSGAQAVRPKSSNAVKLLAESLSFITIGAPCLQSKPAQYPVVKLSNIPWSISLADIRQMLFYVRMPDPNDIAQNVHIVINKLTGKTLADAFVEVASEGDAVKAVKNYHHPPVKGRKIYIAVSSQDRLLKELFPEWPGKFVNGKAILTENKDPDAPPPPLIQRKEFESLLAICRNFKLHFSRKCGERPFENFISLLVKFPWDQPDIITTMQRDHLYEYYKLATSVLKNHLAKPYVNLDPQLMTRMIRAALQCPGLTVPQKRGILVAGNVECPPDLTEFIEPPPEAVIETEPTILDRLIPMEPLDAASTL